jgi:hypothetical protein
MEGGIMTKALVPQQGGDLAFVALDRAHSGGGMSARAIRYMLFSLNS